MSKPILIVTEKFDPHADAVIEKLRERDRPFFRLNSDDFHIDYYVDLDGRDGVMSFHDRWGRSVRFPDGVHAAWHRKPREPNPPEGVTEEAARTTIRTETIELMSYLSCIRTIPWYNNPEDNRVAQRKFPQLRLARELGLKVPRTLVTNDPARARTFQQDVGGDLLCKPMKEPGFTTDDEIYFIFARKVGTQEFDDNLDRIALCPTLLQEYTPKAYELRVTIIGDKVFACRLDLQRTPGAETDWRRVSPEKVAHSLIDLEPAVEDRLREMLRLCNLRFGAFDLIVTPEDETVFLELNPNGQWLWIELLTGAPMVDAMTDLLLS